MNAVNAANACGVAALVSDGPRLHEETGGRSRRQPLRLRLSGDFISFSVIYIIVWFLCRALTTSGALALSRDAFFGSDLFPLISAKHIKPFAHAETLGVAPVRQQCEIRVICNFQERRGL